MAQPKDDSLNRMQEIFSVVSSIVDRRLAEQNSAIMNIGSFVSK